MVRALKRNFQVLRKKQIFQTYYMAIITALLHAKITWDLPNLWPGKPGNNLGFFLLKKCYEPWTISYMLQEYRKHPSNYIFYFTQIYFDINIVMILYLRCLCYWKISMVFIIPIYLRKYSIYWYLLWSICTPIISTLTRKFKTFHWMKLT